MKTFLDSEGRLSLPDGYPEDQVRLPGMTRPVRSGGNHDRSAGAERTLPVDLSGEISARTDGRVRHRSGLQSLRGYGSGSPTQTGGVSRLLIMLCGS